jgi:type II secretory pathway component PulC
MPLSLAIAPNISPLVTGKATYSLVGVLESGDRSSALFNWNGLTQRVQIGEPLGASGWVLKSVNSQKAILSRQGKTRYLEVGQRF